MKKIRILALILALLMLPLGMLVSCKKDEEGPVGDGGDDGTTVQKRPTTNTNAVDDGTAEGYLCYYTFDPAPTGMFSAAAPYTLFANHNVGDFVFGRRDVGGKKGGYLGIVRGAAKETPYYDITVMGLAGFTFTHVISFDIYLGGGVVNDGIFFTGRKGSGIFNDFLSFNANGQVYAGGKYQVYTAKQEGEWVNFAVAINDKTREFDVYVNGVKTLVKVPYPTATYEDWDTMKIDRYRIGIRGNNAEKTEVRIDNFAVSTGLTPKNVSGSDVTYTDIYTEKGEILSFAGVDASKQTVVDIYSSNPTLVNAIKNNAYASSKLLMSNTVSLAKLQFIGDVGIGTELQYDYGVETGEYKYGANIGGKTFYSDPEVGKSFEFRSDIIKEGTDIGKLIVVNENGKTGTYTLEGDETLTKITIIIDNVITYAVYSNGVFKTVSDDTFNPDDVKAVEYHEGAFHGKDYSYTVGSIDDTEGERISIVFSPDQINRKADFSMQINDADPIKGTNIPFVYDSGILTFSLDGTIYYFAYNALSDEFTLYDPAGSYLLKPPANEEITVSESELLALHYQSFGSGTGSLVIPVDPEVASAKEWEKFYFEIYLTEKMASFKFGLFLYCGNYFYYMPLSYSKMGLYQIAIPFEEFTKSADVDINIAELTKIEFKMTGSQSGTSFGPYGDENGSLGNDGHDFYILNLALIQEKIAEVGGPTKEGVDYCTHQAQDGSSYLEPVDEPIEPTCTSIGYYAMRCSYCGATVIDDDKPIKDALGHTTEGQVVMIQYPSCGEAGYTYQNCKKCNEKITISELPVLSHEYYEILNNAAGRMDYQCKNCGRQYSTYLNNTLMSGKEKYDLLPEGSKSIIVYENYNDTVKVGSLTEMPTSQVAVPNTNANINPKYATFEATRVGTDYCFEYTKGLTLGSVTAQNDAYFDMEVSGNLGAGVNFVFEFDIMLGSTNDDGEYGQIIAYAIDRSVSPAKWLKVFDINRSGELVIANSTDPAIKLDPEKFTNIAIVVEPVANAKTVYVNGVFAGKGQFDIDNASGKFSLNQIRIQYGQAANTEAAEKDANTSFLYNHMYVYKADAPLCIVNTDMIKESKGSLGLYESATPEDGAVAVTELTNILENKTLYLKSPDKSSDYTFSFTLNSAAALGNGTLLKGEKLDVYNTLVSADILTVKDGYLYYMGIPVHKLVAGEDVNIKLVCEDYLSRVTVIVNDKEIITKKAYSTGDTYAKGDSYIRNYTFCSEVGEYSVKNISFVTTAQTAE